MKVKVHLSQRRNVFTICDISTAWAQLRHIILIMSRSPLIKLTLKIKAAPNPRSWFCFSWSVTGCHNNTLKGIKWITKPWIDIFKKCAALQFQDTCVVWIFILIRHAQNNQTQAFPVIVFNCTTFCCTSNPPSFCFDCSLLEYSERIKIAEALGAFGLEDTGVVISQMCLTWLWNHPRSFLSCLLVDFSKNNHKLLAREL